MCEKVVTTASRKDQTLFTKDSKDLQERNVGQELSQSRGSILTFMWQMLLLSFAFTFVLGLGVGIGIGFGIWGPPLRRKREILNSCSTQNSTECLKTQEYMDHVARICGAIDKEDMTYKLAKKNFDQAVLRETLYYRGHLEANITKNRENSKM